MDWGNIVSLLVSGGVLGSLGSIFYFRPKLKEAKAEASKAETSAKKERNEYLQGRIESMERLYKQQGDLLDEVRKQVLSLQEEALNREQVITDLKDENRKLADNVETLKEENRSLSDKVANLENEIKAYKTGESKKKK